MFAAAKEAGIANKENLMQIVGVQSLNDMSPDDIREWTMEFAKRSAEQEMEAELVEA